MLLLKEYLPTTDQGEFRVGKIRQLPVENQTTIVTIEMPFKNFHIYTILI